MDLYFQGLACFNRSRTPDNVAQARDFFDRALTADPENVEALVGSGARGCDRRREFLCDRSHRGFRVRRSEADQSPVGRPGPRAWSHGVGICRYSDQARRGGYRRMSTRTGARPKPRQRPCLRWAWSNLRRSRRRNGGSHCRGPSSQSARYNFLHLDDFRGPGETPPRHVTSKRSLGFGGRSRPTEIIR